MTKDRQKLQTDKDTSGETSELQIATIHHCQVRSGKVKLVTLQKGGSSP